MTQHACKRFWEGTVGISIRPQKKRNGGYFWTFSFVRAFRRSRDSGWEYAQHYGQQHAKAVGLVMSKAFQFMQDTDPGEFLAASMAEATQDSPPAVESNCTLDDAQLPAPEREAA